MSEHIDNIVTYLRSSAELYERVQEDGLNEQLIALRQWQCERLLNSHAEMCKVPKFQVAIQFFVDELYGPKDFSQRDKDIERVVPKMKKWLPDEALESLAVAIHLNALSQELDVAMLRQLNGSEINRDSYAQAYVACNNPTERTLQIDYIEQLGLDLAQVVRLPGIGLILKMARTPAKMAGLATLQEFLENGFTAFKRLGDVQEFIVPVVNKERDIMQQLFAGENPLPAI
ncbi:FFLEELY motif protein [Planctobacterium marinum]|uniref:FFLEELY motif protein n=1 Tax=Planctobacterium marinum TaxID=1631968 RepID=UPI001E2A01A6|nr:hypothetical protein [Planctobacterium marinum]MCC2605908.1 hypothetical protein [Planctobacterium marinum]